MQEQTEPLPWEVYQKLLSDMAFKILTSKDDSKRITLARYHTIIAIGGYIGLRGGDLLASTWESYIYSKELKLQEGKTKKTKRVFVPDALARIVRHNHDIIQPYSMQLPILVSSNELKPISLQAFNEMLKRIFKEFGVETPNCSSHVLRKTFALRVFEKLNKTEEALITVQKLLNHRTSEETLTYLGITKKHLLNVYKLL